MEYEFGSFSHINTRDIIIEADRSAAVCRSECLQALVYMMQYPARVELHVITEHRHKLVATGQRWHFPAAFEACSFDQSHDDGNDFSIAWEHRHHLRQAFNSGAS